jgi:hypothetical protein
MFNQFLILRVRLKSEVLHGVMWVREVVLVGSVLVASLTG